MYLTPFRPTFQVMEAEDKFDDGFTILSYATTIWLSMWRYTGLPDTSLAWGFRLHQVQNRRRSVLKFDPSRVQSRRLHDDMVKFWVHKRGVGRSRCIASPWEGLLVNDCDEEAPDHDEEQFDGSAAGDHDSSTSSDESSSFDGGPLASSRIAEEPAPEPSVEEGGHSVGAQLARVSASFRRSAAKVVFEASDHGRIAVYEYTDR